MIIASRLDKRLPGGILLLAKGTVTTSALRLAVETFAAQAEAIHALARVYVYKFGTPAAHVDCSLPRMSCENP